MRSARPRTFDECDYLAYRAEAMRDFAEKNLRQRRYVDLAKVAVYVGCALASGYTFYGLLRLGAMLLRALKVNVSAF